LKRFYSRDVAQLLVLAALVIDVAHGFLDVWRYNGPPGRSGTVDWVSYGRDPGGSRYSPLAQIDRSNARFLMSMTGTATNDFRFSRDLKPFCGVANKGPFYESRRLARPGFSSVF
jgi:hypothetical protein